MKGNAAVVLDNHSPHPGQAALDEAVETLTRILDDDEPLVREHAARALDRLRGDGLTTR